MPRLARDGSRRHRDDGVLSARAGAVGGAAVFAALRAELGVIAKRQQGVLMGDGLEQTTSPPVAAHAPVGAAARDVGLAAEAHAATSAVAALDEDLDPIDEHGHGTRPGRRTPGDCRFSSPPAGRSRAGRARRGPRSGPRRPRARTGVWSLARPTFLPGFHLVPCCRTRMVPPVTCSPPKRFTPSRWALLSRPLRLEPCPFLCAMAHTTFPEKLGAATVAGGAARHDTMRRSFVTARSSRSSRPCRTGGGPACGGSACASCT